MAGESGSAVNERHYFVDEAGDPVLFNRRKQVVVGKQGCSKLFILGLLDVAYPDTLSRELGALRQQLLADPYFKGVPSMQPKTAKDGFCLSREG